MIGLPPSWEGLPHLNVTDWLSKSVIPGSFGGLGGSVENNKKHLFDGQST